MRTTRLTLLFHRIASLTIGSGSSHTWKQWARGKACSQPSCLAKPLISAKMALDSSLVRMAWDPLCGHGEGTQTPWPVVFEEALQEMWYSIIFMA